MAGKIDCIKFLRSKSDMDKEDGFQKLLMDYLEEFDIPLESLVCTVIN